MAAAKKEEKKAIKTALVANLKQSIQRLSISMVEFEVFVHRDHSINIDRANIQGQGIACTKSFDVGFNIS